MTGYAEASLCLANSMRRSSAGSSARRCPHETRRKRYEFRDSSDLGPDRAGPTRDRAGGGRPGGTGVSETRPRPPVAHGEVRQGQESSSGGPHMPFYGGGTKLDTRS